MTTLLTSIPSQSFIISDLYFIFHIEPANAKLAIIIPPEAVFPLVLKTTIYFCQKSEAQNLTYSANHYDQRIITVKDNQVMFLERLHPVTNVWACCPRVVEHWRSLEMKRTLDTTGTQPEEVAKSKTELLIRSPQHL